MAPPGVIPHRAARRSPDAATRLTAHALSTVTGLVQCDLALFRSISRRLEIGDGIVLDHTRHEAAETPIEHALSAAQSTS